MLTLSLLVVVAACDDDVTVTPPPPAPQIKVTQTYAKSSTGLPNNDVYAMLTVSNGEFWIGTEQGVARYPSVSATSRIPGPQGIINEVNGLPNPKVRDIVEFDNKVYVATWGGGFAIYDIAGETWSSRTVANGLANGSIWDMDVSPTESRVYCATNNGVSIYNTVSNTFTTFTNLTREQVSSVATRNSSGGVERWYGPRVESLEDEELEPLPAGITVSGATPSVYTMTTENSALPEANVTSIYVDEAAGPRIFWVTLGSKGVSRVDVDAGTWTTYTIVDGLPSNTVYSITRADGPSGETLWVATQDGVAWQKSNGKWQGYNTAGGLAYDRVRKVYSDNGVRLWIGYVNGGAARLDPNSAKTE